MLNLNDPFLQALVQLAVQQQQQQQLAPSGLTMGAAPAQPTSGGLPAERPIVGQHSLQSTIPTLRQPDPMQSLMQSPVYQGLSPAEQILSQGANMRAFAQPDQDRLAFEQNTINYHQGIEQENTGVYDRRMAALNALEIAKVKAQNELDKVIAPAKLRLQGDQAGKEADRLRELDTEYLKAMSKPPEGLDPAGLKEWRESLTAHYLMLRKNTDTGGGAPVSKAQAVIDKYRETMDDNQIRSLIASDIAKNPKDEQKLAALKPVLDYLHAQNTTVTGAPLKSSGPSVAGGSSAPAKPQPAKEVARQTGQPQGVLSQEEQQAALALRERIQSIIPTLQQQGKQSYEGMKSGMKRDLESIGWTAQKVNAFLEVLFG